MNKDLNKTKKFIYFGALVFIVLFSIGYSALSSTRTINGSMRYTRKAGIRVTNIVLQGVTNSGTEQFSPSYNYNTTTTGVNLPNLNSTVSYTVTIKNYENEAKPLRLSITSNSNSNITFTSSNMPTNNMVPANSTVNITVTVKYGASTLPATTTDTMTIIYKYTYEGAMFIPGIQINAKMKQFIDSGADYTTDDTTITNFTRYTGTPSSTYLTNTYKVSLDEYEYPIYMWYDSGSTTIYWYSNSSTVYFNPNSEHFFQLLSGLNGISNLNDINSSKVTTMSQMFYHTGYSSTSFTLTLGSNFDTSNVTNMNSLFYMAGYNSTSFTLSLGPNFDTSNVTDMTNMFNSTGYKSTVMTLDLGSKFNTSNVTTMYGLFYQPGYKSTVFTINLGSLFYTSNVTDMGYMFGWLGNNSTVFTLNLGSNFDTTNVTNMERMFLGVGASNTSFTFSLGSKFDTSNVTNMSMMFQGLGKSGTNFTLSLGSKFNTSNVTTMFQMFKETGRNSPSFTLDLGSQFYTSNVTDMEWMFDSTGYSSTVFTLNLGSHFDTSKVTTMQGMFARTGYTNTTFSFSLGSLFDTSKVTNMRMMFDSTGYNSTTFTINFGSKFNTSLVTNMQYMFGYIGYANPSFSITLPSTFYTSNVTDFSYMFYKSGTGSSSYVIDLGLHFDTSSGTTFNFMFQDCTSLMTIYTTQDFSIDRTDNYDRMYLGCTNLVGGAGTVYVSSWTDGRDRSVIDQGTSKPGYFTEKKFYLDINGYLDGENTTSVAGYGKCNVKINGSQVATNVTDYYVAWPAGTTYQITCTPDAGFSGGTTTQSGSLSGTITGPGTTGVRIIFDTLPLYYLDLNGRLDGTDSGNISGYGTCNIKVNGTTVSSNATDYYQQHYQGSTYQITCTANSGYKYNGVVSGSLSGTINGPGTTSVRVSFSTNTETLTFGSCSKGPELHAQCYATAQNVSSNYQSPSAISITWTNATITQAGQAGDMVIYAQYYNGSAWKDFTLSGGGDYYYGKGKYCGDNVFTCTKTISVSSVPSTVQKIRIGVYSNANAYNNTKVTLGSGSAVITG